MAKTDFTADLAFEIEGTSQTAHCRDIQAILFDLDGTLIATRQLYVAAYAEALAPHFGKHLTEAEIMALSPLGPKLNSSHPLFQHPRRLRASKVSTQTTRLCT